MTTNAIDRVLTRPTVAVPATVSQATAIEQSRAVAEVQAAVVVAQNIPRDMVRAEAEMRDACRRMALANRAFYKVPNRGTGPSVHLARELARIWGNIQYGVHELRRDDAAQESEVQAFAWDVQTNTRSTRTFVNPHARMKRVDGRQSREALVDLGDIYLSNQNVGARAVRECIFTVLPTWFTEEAQTICQETLRHGEGKPLPERITDMVSAFRSIGVTVDQLEAKIGRKRGQWDAGDVAQMTIVYTSITRDGLSKDEEFPPQRVTADDIVGSAAPSQREPERRAEAPQAAGSDFTPMTDGESRKMFATFNDAARIEPDLGTREGQLGYIAQQIGRQIKSRKELTSADAKKVTAALEGFIAKSEPPTGGES